VSRKDPIPESLAGLAESERVELKTGRVKPEVIGRDVCAFANAQGGTILVGVTQSGRLVGVPERNRFIERLRNLIGAHLSPQVSVSIVPLDIEGKDLVAIDVPQGSSRPYTWNRTIYVRVDEKVKEADGAAIISMLSTPSFFHWERHGAFGIEVDDIDDAELRRAWEDAYDRQFDSKGMGKWPGVLEALQRFNMVDSGQICNGGLVLFGKTPAVRLPQTRVRAVAYRDEQGNALIDNRSYAGHAFSLVEAMMQFLKEHVPIQSQIPRDRLQRHEEPALPFVALREAVLNAVQHRDYEALDGGISLVVRPTGVELWNSGTLPTGMTVDDLKTGHHSRPHNPGIAHVFFLRGFVERIGSGSTRMVEECRRAGLPDPNWSQDSGGVSVTFRRGLVSSDLNERQRTIAQSLRFHETITAAEYREKFRVSERQARSDLSDMAERGYVRRIGAGRATQYERTTKVL
jgi:ATP-dependent DNA helicase RecG